MSANTMATTSRRSASAGLVAAAAGLALAAAEPARAERWELLPSVSGQLLQTSNSDLSANGRADTVLSVRPQLAINATGSRVRLGGTLGLDAVTYARGTQDDRVLPQVDLTGRIEPVERLFVVEASYRVAQVAANPFGVRSDAGSTTNIVTTRTARLSPSLQGGVPGDLNFRVSGDFVQLRQNDAAGVASDASGTYAQGGAQLEMPAKPFGWRLQADRSISSYDNEAKPSLETGDMLAAVTYAFNEDLVAGLRGGRESENVDGVKKWHGTSGVELKWTPTARTTLNATRDKRFFGHAWQLDFSHRMPWLALNLGLSRSIDTTPQTLFLLPATNDVAGLLDAIFTTRYPDPAERARVVREVIDRNGLSTATTGPVNLLGQRLSLTTRRRIGLVLNGVVNTLSLGAFSVRTEDLLTANPLSVGTAEANNTQSGGSLSLTHRLDAYTAVSVSLDRTRIQALPGFGDSSTTQRGLRAELNAQVAPRTNVLGGLRYRKIDSNSSTSEGDETALFVGVDHRF